MDLPLKQIKNLLKTLEDGGASEFEYEDEKVRVRVSMARGAPMVSAAHAPQVTVAAAPAHAAAKEEKGDPSVVFITSPFVGTFYRAPAPDADPFVEAGGAVKKGQTLCIVEAMKLMNEIEAEFPGTILDVLVENGQSVEFGQKLFKLKKS
ncbi:MAG: acetyl-CoA carboxylase biotin carboxyl carrier protein [Polyangiaceae bacterium]|nr:acetyl-CoA carboxylase biotin carboxyl carrier protein [Polyangiaceae bacterium]